MRKTYAYNSIIIGVLLGMLVGIKAGTALGIVVGIVVTVVGFFIIKAIENVINKGVDAAASSIKTAIDNKKAQAEAEIKICPKCGSKQSKDATFCRSCGSKLN